MPQPHAQNRVPPMVRIEGGGGTGARAGRVGAGTGARVVAAAGARAAGTGARPAAAAAGAGAPLRAADKAIARKRWAGGQEIAAAGRRIVLSFPESSVVILSAESGKPAVYYFPEGEG